MIKRKTKNSPFSPCATLHPTSSSPPGHSGRPLCLTWHPELGRVHEILGKEPMNFPFLNRSRRWDFVASKGRFEDNYENVQMFKCSNAKTLKITPHTTQVVFFFPGEWSDTSPRNVEHPKLLTTARRVPAQVMSFWKPEVIFLIIWSFIKQLIQT